MFTVVGLLLGDLNPLVATTGETAHLAVLDGDEVLYLEKVEGTHRLRMPSAVGRRVPSYCTALGKTMLADPEAGPRAHPRQRAVSRPDPSHPDDGGSAPGRARPGTGPGVRRGRRELEDGLMCVAAPVRDPERTTCAAISIAGPASRIGRRLQSDINAVRAAAEQLSRELGPHARRLVEGFPTTGDQLGPLPVGGKGPGRP
jgi:DNA-binding IclR family transcriptional regulator